MTKHTQGLWVAIPAAGDGRDLEFRGTVAVVRAEGRNIVIIAPMQTVNDVAEQGEANARLLFAAPELLEALESLTHDDGHIEACGNGGGDPDDCSPKCRKVQAALAKARGP